jgi:hypothetical protein
MILQYAAETKSPGLRFAEEEMLRDEGSEWRSWFISDSGPILPPCPDSSCSVLEKLAIVQLCVDRLGCINITLFMYAGYDRIDLQLLL